MNNNLEHRGKSIFFRFLCYLRYAVAFIFSVSFHFAMFHVMFFSARTRQSPIPKDLIKIMKITLVYFAFASSLLKRVQLLSCHCLNILKLSTDLAVCFFFMILFSFLSIWGSCKMTTKMKTFQLGFFEACTMYTLKEIFFPSHLLYVCVCCVRWR